MLKVDKLSVVVNVDEVLNQLGFANIDFADYYTEDGIYEVKIGSRGELEDIVMNDQYVSLKELKEDNDQYEEEWYDVTYHDEGYGIDLLEVQYYEESYSVYMLVEEK